MLGARAECAEKDDQQSNNPPQHVEDMQAGNNE